MTKKQSNAKNYFLNRDTIKAGYPADFSSIEEICNVLLGRPKKCKRRCSEDVDDSQVILAIIGGIGSGKFNNELRVENDEMYLHIYNLEKKDYGKPRTKSDTRIHHLFMRPENNGLLEYKGSFYATDKLGIYKRVAKEWKFK